MRQQWDFSIQLDARTWGVGCNFWIFRQKRPNRHLGASVLGFQAGSHNSIGKGDAFARSELRKDYGRDASNRTSGWRKAAIGFVLIPCYFRSLLFWRQPPGAYCSLDYYGSWYLFCTQ